MPAISAIGMQPMLEIGGDKVEAEDLGDDDQALVLMEEGRIEQQETLVPLAGASDEDAIAAAHA